MGAGESLQLERVAMELSARFPRVSERNVERVGAIRVTLVR